MQGTCIQSQSGVMRTRLNSPESYARAALAVALMAACASTASSAHAVGKADKLKIVCTTTMIADLARQLAGEAVETHDA